MGFYYPIPAGALVTCMNCHAMLIRHFDERGGWRGCPVGEHERLDGHAVFLVSTNRRRRERRGGMERRSNEERAGSAGSVPVETGITRPPLLSVQQAQPPSGLVPLAAGPRGAVYMATPGTGLRGQTGQMAKVFQVIAGSPQGKTMAELKKELKLKQKSLESVLYRLKLQGLVRAYNAYEVRG